MPTQINEKSILGVGAYCYFFDTSFVQQRNMMKRTSRVYMKRKG